MAWTAGIAATKGTLIGVQRVIFHRDNDGMILLVTCHRGSPFFLLQQAATNLPTLRSKVVTLWLVVRLSANLPKSTTSTTCEAV